MASALALAPCGAIVVSPGRASAAAAAEDWLTVPVGSEVVEDLGHFRSLGMWRGSLEIQPLRRADLSSALRQIEGSPRFPSLGEGDLARYRRLRDWLAAERGVDGAGGRVDGEVGHHVDGESGHVDRVSGRVGGESGHVAGEGAPVEGEGGPVDGEGAPVDGEGRRFGEDGVAAPEVAVVEDRGSGEHFRLGAALQYVGAATALESPVDLDRASRREAALLIGLQAAFGSRVTFEGRFYEDYSRLTARPRRGYVDNLPPDARGIVTDPSARNDLAALAFGWEKFELRVGREDRWMGAGRRGTLFLSDHPFPLDGVSMRARLSFVTFASLFAQTRRGVLPTGSTGTPADSAGSDPGDAYLSAHRLEIHPPWPVRLGLYEAVVFAGRGLDLAYLNPTGFYLAMTQDLLDRAGVDDKKVVGADLQVLMPPVRLYGEYLVNRVITLDTAREGEEAEISSSAFLVGLEWADPVGLSGTSLLAELAHLDPEVYFHKDRNQALALFHQGELIGHWLGPNAELVYLRVSLPPGRTGTLRVSLEQARWGLIDGRRGDEVGFVGLRKKNKRWLTGSIQTERALGLSWEPPRRWTAWPGSPAIRLDLAWAQRKGAWPQGTESGLQIEGRICWPLFTTRYPARPRSHRSRRAIGGPRSHRSRRAIGGPRSDRFRRATGGPRSTVIPGNPGDSWPQ